MLLLLNVFCTYFFFSGSNLNEAEITSLLDASFNFSSDDSSSDAEREDEFDADANQVTVDVLLQPPRERGDAVSDEDSDDEDAPTGDRIHLPARDDSLCNVDGMVRTVASLSMCPDVHTPTLLVT